MQQLFLLFCLLAAVNAHAQFFPEEPCGDCQEEPAQEDPVQQDLYQMCSADPNYSPLCPTNVTTGTTTVTYTYEENYELTDDSSDDLIIDELTADVNSTLEELLSELPDTDDLDQSEDIQKQIIILWNYTPGFELYKNPLEDATFYETKKVYPEYYVRENSFALRNGLAQEITHKKMVLLQWER